MAKDYPIEIENVGDETYIVMSRGHHDVHEFMRQVRADGYSWPLGMPQHVWMRAVPSRDPFVICRYVESSEGARGAFPSNGGDGSPGTWPPSMRTTRSTAWRSATGWSRKPVHRSSSISSASLQARSFQEPSNELA
ncbi:hypothetical protein [Burkholderia ubonensis]|uniref:hypothetical protein n=1 Tax=Burkholderia ubonensis TaxID=101571 RepID=UPI000AA34EE0|nr:hypothetical protein [Burkholderia ubonensis]